MIQIGVIDSSDFLFIHKDQFDELKFAFLVSLNKLGNKYGIRFFDGNTDATYVKYLNRKVCTHTAYKLKSSSIDSVRERAMPHIIKSSGKAVKSPDIIDSSTLA